MIMKHLPLFLDIKNRHCLVIGGGPVASRKVSNLLRSGGKVTVISPEVDKKLQQKADDNKITLVSRKYQETDIVRAFLVVAATSNTDVNREIAEAANKANILVNVADNPNLGSFIFPSVIDRSPVTIAVSTGGASPVLARQLRMKLETMIPTSCGRLAGITEDYRQKVKDAFPEESQRKEFWETALKGAFAELVYAGQEQAARKLLDEALENKRSHANGEVYLVGAGPGDPDLLTFKAVRLMQQADVMVYDRLVSKSILDMANKDAERLYVGKEKENHAVPQDKINDLLVDLAKQANAYYALKVAIPLYSGVAAKKLKSLRRIISRFRLCQLSRQHQAVHPMLVYH